MGDSVPNSASGDDFASRLLSFHERVKKNCEPHEGGIRGQIPSTRKGARLSVEPEDFGEPAREAPGKKDCEKTDRAGPSGQEAELHDGPSETTTASEEDNNPVEENPCEFSLSDLEFVRTIGTGTFGVVQLVKHRRAGTHFALKVMEKCEVLRLKQVEHVHHERAILLGVDNPFVVRLFKTFQDSNRIYLLMEFVRGGELFRHLRMAGRFDKEVARFYAAEVLCALECLHARDIIYRDLKPENILLDQQGHVRITDFGFSKHVPGGRTYTLCGTPEYLAPEVVSGSGHSKGADVWSFGILLYEMLVGSPPFLSSTTYGTYVKILEGDILWPECLDGECKDLISRLLNRNPTKRLGCQRWGLADIKRHPFFSSVDWRAVERRELKPPIVPVVEFSSDTRNFDKYDEEDELVLEMEKEAAEGSPLTQTERHIRGDDMFRSF